MSKITIVSPKIIHGVASVKSLPLIVHCQYPRARRLAALLVPAGTIPSAIWGAVWPIDATNQAFIFLKLDPGKYHCLVYDTAQPALALKVFQVRVLKRAATAGLTNPGFHIQAPDDGDPIGTMVLSSGVTDFPPADVRAQMHCGNSTTHHFPSAPKGPDTTLMEWWFISFPITEMDVHDPYRIDASDGHGHSESVTGLHRSRTIRAKSARKKPSAPKTKKNHGTK